jgi:hypothetical protein
MAATEQGVGGFLSPFEVPAPEGCEGWESMYPYYALFSEERRASEQARGWFRDGMHFPEPMYPFDFVTADSPYLLGQANSRIFVVPPALGVDHRVLYGWVYMSANSVTDEAEIGRRAELFMPRAGYYFQHWDELYRRWLAKVEETIHDLESLEVPDLPELEDMAVVTEGRGIGSSHTLLVAYNRLHDRIRNIHYDRGQLLWANIAVHEPPQYAAEQDNPGGGAQPRLYGARRTSTTSRFATSPRSTSTASRAGRTFSARSTACGTGGGRLPDATSSASRSSQRRGGCSPPTAGARSSGSSPRTCSTSGLATRRT